MNGSRRPLVVIVVMVVLALLAMAMVVAGMATFGLLARLDARLTAILIVVLAAALIVAGGLRALAGLGERRVRREAKLTGYAKLLETLSEAPPFASEPDAGNTIGDWRRAERAALLLASPGVLKTLARLRADAPAQPGHGAAVAALVREMRRDLGESNLTLNDDDLVDLVLASDPRGHPR
jgi:hypothetical protein